jgi:hypothetical protein
MLDLVGFIEDVLGDDGEDELRLVHVPVEEGGDPLVDGALVVFGLHAHSQRPS